MGLHQTFEHIKTGKLYTKIWHFQNEADNITHVLYCSHDTGILWGRPAKEFAEKFRFKEPQS